MFFSTNSDIHTHNTSNKDKLRNQFGNADIMYRTFSYHGTKLWNIIIRKLDINVSYTCFRNVLKQYTIGNDITIERYT